MSISDQQRRFFDTFGYLFLKGHMADCIHEITDAFEEVWRDYGGGHGGKLHSGEKRSVLVPFIDRHERLCALLDDPRIVGVVESILGPDFNYCTSDGNYYTGNTKYHSHPFFGDLKAIKVAFYLDPLTADTGCLRVIPGSHRFGDWYAETLHTTLDESEEMWGIPQSQVPAIPLEIEPGDIIIFSHCLKHGSFGGGSQRRLFVINCSARFPDDKTDDLRRMVAGSARFWNEEFYGRLMVETAGPERMKHLEQVLANQDHLPALAAKARSEMLEPSRG